MRVSLYELLIYISQCHRISCIKVFTKEKTSVFLIFCCIFMGKVHFIEHLSDILR